jgi:hypothetical protein
MIEPSLDHHFPRDRFQPLRPRQKLNSARDLLLAIAISYQTYGTTSVSEDQISKCCKSIAPQIVDFDQPRSTSKAGPYSCTAGPASLQNECDRNNWKSLHHHDLVLREIFGAITFAMTFA